MNKKRILLLSGFSVGVLSILVTTPIFVVTSLAAKKRHRIGYKLLESSFVNDVLGHEEYFRSKEDLHTFIADNYQMFITEQDYDDWVMDNDAYYNEQLVQAAIEETISEIYVDQLISFDAYAKIDFNQDQVFARVYKMADNTWTRDREQALSSYVQVSDKMMTNIDQKAFDTQQEAEDHLLVEHIASSPVTVNPLDGATYNHNTFYARPIGYQVVGDATAVPRVTPVAGAIYRGNTYRNATAYRGQATLPTPVRPIVGATYNGRVYMSAGSYQVTSINPPLFVAPQPGATLGSEVYMPTTDYTITPPPVTVFAQGDTLIDQDRTLTYFATEQSVTQSVPGVVINDDFSAIPVNSYWATDTALLKWESPTSFGVMTINGQQVTNDQLIKLINNLIPGQSLDDVLDQPDYNSNTWFNSAQIFGATYNINPGNIFEVNQNLMNQVQQNLNGVQIYGVFLSDTHTRTIETRVVPVGWHDLTTYDFDQSIVPSGDIYRTPTANAFTTDQDSVQITGTNHTGWYPVNTDLSNGFHNRIIHNGLFFPKIGNLATDGTGELTTDERVSEGYFKVSTIPNPAGWYPVNTDLNDGDHSNDLLPSPTLLYPAASNGATDGSGTLVSDVTLARGYVPGAIGVNPKGWYPTNINLRTADHASDRLTISKLFYPAASNGATDGTGILVSDVTLARGYVPGAVGVNPGGWYPNNINVSNGNHLHDRITINALLYPAASNGANDGSGALVSDETLARGFSEHYWSILGSSTHYQSQQAAQDHVDPQNDISAVIQATFNGHDPVYGIDQAAAIAKAIANAPALFNQEPVEFKSIALNDLEQWVGSDFDALPDHRTKKVFFSTWNENFIFSNHQALMTYIENNHAHHIHGFVINHNIDYLDHVYNKLDAAEDTLFKIIDASLVNVKEDENILPDQIYSGS